MRVLVLGGTGSIGGAVVRVLQERGHDVLALGRSAQACQALQKAGAIPVEGDIREPVNWIDVVQHVDGIVHSATVWGEDMGQVDRQLVEALLEKLKQDSSSTAFVYTGGCWLYGETGNVVATENTLFKPPVSYAWSIPVIQMVLAASCARGMVIHPAMVYERNGGVFEHIFEDARHLGYVRVIGGENVRWPLVHRDDLAHLYALMLERGKQGDVYNAAAIHGVPIGIITRTIARRLGIEADPVVCDVETAKTEIGSWAEGYALDQQMSGQKATQTLGWRPKHLDVIAEVA